MSRPKQGFATSNISHGVAQFAGEHGALDIPSREIGDRCLGRRRSNTITRNEILGHTCHGGELEPPATTRQGWAVEAAKHQVFGHTHAWDTGVAQRFLREATDAVLGHLLARSPIRLSTDLDGAGHQRTLPGEDFD